MTQTSRMEQQQCPMTSNTMLVEVNVAHMIDNCEVSNFLEEIKTHVELQKLFILVGAKVGN